MKILGIDSGKLSKWLAIIFAGASVICILALLISGLPAAIRNGERWPSVKVVPGKDLSFDVTQDFPIGEIEYVNIDISFETAELTTISGDSFQVQYLGSARNADNWSDVFTMEVRDNALVLESHWANVISLGGNVRLEVGVPAGFNGDLIFSGVSGSLRANDIDVGVFEARLVSGRMNVSGIEADMISLRTTSGELNVEELKAGTISLRSVSGGIDASKMEAAVISGKSSSGRIDLQDISGSLVFSSVSGGVVASFAAPGNEIDIDVSSGRINVTLPAGTGFDLDARSSSGRIESDFPVAVTGSRNRNSLKGQSGNGDGRTVKLHSVSGGINLNEG